jgi:hypothetical protein
VPFISKHHNYVNDIPPGEPWHVVSVYVHRGIGTAEKSYICPRETFGEPCPICEFIGQEKKKGNLSQDQETALKPKHQELYNVIDVTRENDNLVQIHMMSYWNFGKVLGSELEAIEREEGDSSCYEYPLLVGGSTLKCRFVKTKKGGFSFMELDKVDLIPREDYDESILDETFDLLDMLKRYSYEELEKIFLMETDPDDANTTEPERTESFRRERGKRKQEEEPEEEPPFDEDEEEEEEKPARSRRGSKGEEPPEDEDEEESEEPKSRKRPAKEPEPEEDTCPVEDGEFGRDTDVFEECVECPIWDACTEAKEQAEKKKKPEPAKEKPARKRPEPEPDPEPAKRRRK